jgi:hypothetical protein
LKRKEITVVKLTVLALFISVACGTCLADFYPQYSEYRAYTIDSNLNISQTVIVDGTTVGDCWLGFIWMSNCPASHSLQIDNFINGVGDTWYQEGEYSAPFLMHLAS